jgi:hypothetical protein
MKLNSPESPDTLVHLFIDLKDWSVAHWSATGFLYDPADRSPLPPSIAFAFRNFDVGKKIFDGWLQRIGHFDTYEELRVSIIEGPVPTAPTGYSVLITSNPLSTIKRKQAEDPAFNPVRFVRTSRLNRMTPAPGSPHLRFFKKHLARVRRYRLIPAHFDGQGIRALDESRYIEKRELNVFHSSQVKPDQVEYSVFSTSSE